MLFDVEELDKSDVVVLLTVCTDVAVVLSPSVVSLTLGMSLGVAMTKVSVTDDCSLEVVIITPVARVVNVEVRSIVDVDVMVDGLVDHEVFLSNI